VTRPGVVLHNNCNSTIRGNRDVLNLNSEEWAGDLAKILGADIKKKFALYYYKIKYNQLIKAILCIFNQFYRL